ncbi:MAG: hypothetical protein D5S00_02580 [Tindallia sp. MSAO_Bac2]|nr:MAG: hypothetical protein D5S00_02580 [Tindallia sp. MSAO_Bac2]
MLIVLFQLLLILLAILLLLLLLAIMVPFGYHVTASYLNGGYDVFLCGKWFWGFIRFSASFKDSDKPELNFKLLGCHLPTPQELDKTNTAKPRKTKAADTTDTTTKEKRELLNINLLRDVTKFLKQLFRYMTPKKLSLVIYSGFDDPYYIAILNCWIQALSGIKTSGSRKISLHPVFHEETIRAYFKIKGTLVPFVLLYYLLQLVFCQSVRKIWVSAIKHALKNK